LLCAQIPVCSECMLCVHKAPEHVCDRIVDIETKQLEELKSLVLDSEAKVKACEEVSANLENMLTTLQDQKDTAHARILEAFKTYTALLEKRQVHDSVVPIILTVMFWVILCQITQNF